MTICASALSSQPAFASPWDLSYSGRLTDANGAPVAGPLTIRVRFYRAPTGGTAVGVTLPDFTGVTLSEGVFNLTLSLSDADRHSIFNGIDPAYIELTDMTRNVTYPRQVFGVVPYALKVPIDEKVFAYDTDGKLTLLAPPEQGKFLSANAQGELTWVNIGGGDMVRANNLSDLASASTAHTNLGLGNAATKNVGTAAADVAAGNHTHPDVTTTNPGLMSAADKTKLDGISAGAGVVNNTNVDAAGALMGTDFSGNGLLKRHQRRRDPERQQLQQRLFLFGRHRIPGRTIA